MIKFSLAIGILAIAVSVQAKTIKVPSLNGVIHNLNNHKDDNLEVVLKFDCRERYVVSWMRIINQSCGEKVLKAELTKVDEKFIYKFRDADFVFKKNNRFRQKFIGINIELSITDGVTLDAFRKDRLIKLNEFAKKSKIDFKKLSEHISELSLFVLEKQPVTFTTTDGTNGIEKLKSIYKKIDNLRSYLDINNDLGSEELSDFSPFGITAEAWPGKDRTIEQFSLPKIMWFFPGYVPTLKINFQQEIRIEPKEEVDKMKTLVLQEVEYVYPNEFGDKYPTELYNHTIKEDWKY